MKKIISSATAFAISASPALKNALTGNEDDTSKVYFTRDLTPESLVKIYNAHGKEAIGKVAVKINSGESSQFGHLHFITGVRTLVSNK